MVRRASRTGPALHQLTRVPEAAVSLVVDAISVEPSLVWTIAVQEGNAAYPPVEYVEVKELPLITHVPPTFS